MSEGFLLLVVFVFCFVLFFPWRAVLARNSSVDLTFSVNTMPTSSVVGNTISFSHVVNVEVYLCFWRTHSLFETLGAQSSGPE